MPGYTLPDGTKIEWVVLTGRRGPSSADVWDTALWDAASWDGGTKVSWNLLTEAFIYQLRIKQGKDEFGKRFKAGSATLTVDNSDGIFTHVDAGLQPGDYVWISVYVTFPLGPPDEPIPDGWTWNDETGREWTAHGSLVWADDTPTVPVDYSRFYGRVDSAIDTVLRGRDVTKVVCYDTFSELATSDKDAQAPQGAGETSFARVDRIVANATESVGNAGKIGVAEATMQDTTLARRALDQLHITVESEGGDMWASNNQDNEDKGNIIVAGRDWLTTQTRSIEVQYTFGGSQGLTVVNAHVTRERSIVVNDATVSNSGGIAQNSTDSVSVQRYGLRTTRRLDLQADQDVQAQFLANRFVTNLKDVRPRIREVTVPVLTAAAGEMGGHIQFGDLVRTTVSSVNGWSYTALGHVIGIRHEVVEQIWNVVLRLSDAFVENTDGAYNDQEFSNAFTLGNDGGS